MGKFSFYSVSAQRDAEVEMQYRGYGMAPAWHIVKNQLDPSIVQASLSSASSDLEQRALLGVVPKQYTVLPDHRAS